MAQLGAVARQHGVPVSLHGTGGAWMVVAPDADADELRLAVRHSLDRKVCNTLNVCAVVRAGADRLVPAVVGAAREAAAAHGAQLVLHLDDDARALAGDAGRDAAAVGRDELGTEWEWERDPELSIVVVDQVDDAVELFNRYSPRFAASLVSADPPRPPALLRPHRRTVRRQRVHPLGRWPVRVRPARARSVELAGRPAVRARWMSGDSVFTVRTVATVVDHDTHR